MGSCPCKPDESPDQHTFNITENRNPIFYSVLKATELPFKVYIDNTFQFIKLANINEPLSNLRKKLLRNNLVDFLFVGEEKDDFASIPQYSENYRTLRSIVVSTDMVYLRKIQQKIDFYLGNLQLSTIDFKINETLVSFREFLKKRILNLLNFRFLEKSGKAIEKADEPDLVVENVCRFSEKVIVVVVDYFQFSVLLNGEFLFTIREKLETSLNILRKTLSSRQIKPFFFLTDDDSEDPIPLDIESENEITLENIYVDSSGKGRKGFQIMLQERKSKQQPQNNLFISSFPNSEPNFLVNQNMMISLNTKKNNQNIKNLIYVKKTPLLGSRRLSELDFADIKCYQYPKVEFNALEEDASHTLLVFGETGAGKTSLLNTLVNYILKISPNDKLRYFLDQKTKLVSEAKSQTSTVVIHNIRSHNGYPPLRIVDTPGFGDTEGIERDQEITDRIEEAFQKKIKSLTGICVVAKNSDVRLNQKQKYIFQKIMDMFGKEYNENWIFCITFCIGVDDSQAESCLNEFFKRNIKGVPNAFKFNNSAFFNHLNKGPQIEAFFELGLNSFEYLMKKIRKMKEKNILTSLEVMRFRRSLREKAGDFLNLQEQNKELISKMKKIQSDLENVEQFQDFQDKESLKITTIPIYNNNNSVSCLKCCFSCIEECNNINDSNIINCSAMDQSKCCIFCPGKCPANFHIVIPYKFIESKEITRTENQAKNDRISTMKTFLGDIKKKEAASHSKMNILENDIKESLTKDLKIFQNNKSYLDYLELLMNNVKNEKERKYIYEEIKKEEIILKLWEKIIS